MSTKTIFKRIALTAVSALAAGSLAVISVPAANAAAADGATDVFNATGLVGALTPTIAEDLNGSTTRTAVILPTGEIRISPNAAGTITVSAGATIVGVTTQTVAGGATGGSIDASTTVNASQNCAVINVDADLAIIRPTGAAGTTFTIRGYDDESCTTPGLLTDVITVTIAASNQAGTPSAANSIVRWDSNNAGAPTATEDAANASTTTGQTLELYIGVRDVYDQAVDSSAGALVVTVSSGAILGSIAASGASAPSTASTTQVSTSTPVNGLWVYVGEATAGAGWSGTVTVTYNGVLLATKSGKITGNISKLEASALKIGKNNGSATTNAFAFQAYDAAGNAVAVSSNSAVTLSSSSNSSLVTDAVSTAANTTSDAGLGSFTCASGASFVGTSDLILQTILSNGTVVKSAPFKVTCGGPATSYTASWDKATYAQGEIATLTVTFRDAKGALANSAGGSSDALTPQSGTAVDVAISANQMERVTALPGNDATPNASGQLKFTFTVGTSSGIVAGKYNAVVSFPTVNTRGTTAGVATGNASAAYEVVAPASISNAEVLASIVKLIAAINKQIRQLQKSLRR